MLDNLNVEIHYLRRARNGTIRVLPNSVVKVTVPFGVPKSEIKRLLQSKAEWILKKHKALEQIQNQRKVSFISGQLLPFLGEQLQLKIIEGYGPVVKNDLFLVVPVPKNENEIEKYVKASVVKWYKIQAEAQIKERVTHYCTLLGLKYKSIALKNYKSRWGACSSKGELIFNWQIMTFNQNLYNYVVAHEVCHLKEMNHSKKFYNLLDQVGFNKNQIRLQMRYLRNIF